MEGVRVWMWMVGYRLVGRAGLGAVGREWWRLDRRDLGLSKGHFFRNMKNAYNR